MAGTPISASPPEGMCLDQVISKIRKNGLTEIWVVITDFTGDRRLDLREYYRADGAYMPTRKGVSFALDELAPLTSALKALGATTSIGTVAVVSRRAPGELHAGVRQYLGHTYAELRQFILGKNGELTPTKKGITIKHGLIPSVIEAVEMAVDALGSQPVSRGQEVMVLEAPATR